MKRILKQAMLCLLRQRVIVMSWGLTGLIVDEHTIRFHVDGLNYKGKVFIKSFQGHLRITLDSGLSCHVEVEDLITTLDLLIENGPCYEERLMKWIKRKLE